MVELANYNAVFAIDLRSYVVAWVHYQFCRWHVAEEAEQIEVDRQQEDDNGKKGENDYFERKQKILHLFASGAFAVFHFALFAFAWLLAVGIFAIAFSRNTFLLFFLFHSVVFLYSTSLVWTCGSVSVFCLFPTDETS